MRDIGERPGGLQVDCSIRTRKSRKLGGGCRNWGSEKQKNIWEWNEKICKFHTLVTLHEPQLINNNRHRIIKCRMSFFDMPSVPPLWKVWREFYNSHEQQQRDECCFTCVLQQQEQLSKCCWSPMVHPPLKHVSDLKHSLWCPHANVQAICVLFTRHEEETHVAVYVFYLCPLNSLSVWYICPHTTV